LIRAVSFASCYVYSPGGTCAVCERSRLLRTLLKAGDEKFILKYALRVRQQFTDGAVFADYFDSADVLIPVPGCAPRTPGSVWAAEHLAAALVRQGLGRVAWTGLHRVHAVCKSATAAAGRRPTVLSHYESFAMEQPMVAPEKIVLIDDIVTKGRTLLAAATRVHEAFPDARIRAFALVRTLGFIPNIAQLLDPCRGEIRWKAGDAHRSP
jgi:hypothetical protein